MRNGSWNTLDFMHPILERFSMATELFEGDKPSIHLILGTYYQLRQFLVWRREGEPEAHQKAVDAGLEKLDKYFDVAIGKENTLIAPLLNPHFRKLALSEGAAVNEETVQKAVERLGEMWCERYDKNPLEIDNYEYPSIQVPRPAYEAIYSEIGVEEDGKLDPYENPPRNEDDDHWIVTEAFQYLNGGHPALFKEKPEAYWVVSPYFFVFPSS